MALGMPIAFALIACGVALMVHLSMFDTQIIAQNLINAKAIGMPSAMAPHKDKRKTAIVMMASLLFLAGGGKPIGFTLHFMLELFELCLV